MKDLMSQNRNVTLELIAEPGNAGSEETPLQILRRSLRGRLPRVALVSVVLGGACAWTAFNVVPLRYESTGLIRVENTGSTLLPALSERMDGQTYSSFVASQTTYLGSWPVLEQAVSDQRLRDVGWPNGASGVARLKDAISVKLGKGEQLISVSASSSNPRVSKAAVDSVVTAYHELAMLPNDSSEQTEAILLAREATLHEDLEQVQSRILEASDDFGYSAIVRMNEEKINDLVRIDQRLAELRSLQTETEAADNTEFPVAQDTAIATQESDPRLDELKDNEVALLAQLANLPSRFGPYHPTTRDLNRELNTIRIEIELRENALTTRRSNPLSGTIDPEQLALLSIDHLAVLQQQAEAARRELQAQLAVLSRQRMLIADLQRDESDIVSRLGLTRTALERLRTESEHPRSSGIVITSMGDLPAVPVADRRLGFAAVGSVFGAMFGVGIFFFGSLIDPRLRFPDDFTAITNTPPVISVLPVLDPKNDVISTILERRIHQMRSLIETGSSNDTGNVICVTSASRGEGKSSVALAVAASFSAAGNRTLLIDLDLDSRGITREMGLDNGAGVCESIDGDENALQVHRTDQSNLFIMPAGARDRLAPEGLSRQKIITLLDALRSRFDCIIIDTGSILTSVEAFVAVSTADQVVVVASRNQRVKLLQKALDTAARIGADDLAVVFNRADAERVSKTTISEQRSTGIARFVSIQKSDRSVSSGSLPFVRRQDQGTDSQSPSIERRKAA